MSDRADLSHPPILGGPVCTRTADRSLHVNLFLGEGRRCTFDCVYCPFPRRRESPGWRMPGEIGAAVMKALRSGPTLESITVSGAGEPTLHPRFGHVLGEILSARQLARPDLPIRIVTNGTTAFQPRIRRLLDLADERLVRIDAGGDRIARPGNTWRTDASSLRELSDFCVESVFVEGPAGNINEADVSEWIDRLAALHPKHVTITTIGEPPLDTTVYRARPEILEAIAERLRERTNLTTTVLP